MRPPCRNGSYHRLDYFAFFCKVSELVSKTLYENFVELRQSVAKTGASSAETAERGSGLRQASSARLDSLSGSCPFSFLVLLLSGSVVLTISRVPGFDDLRGPPDL